MKQLHEYITIDYNTMSYEKIMDILTKIIPGQEIKVIGLNKESSFIGKFLYNIHDSFTFDIINQKDNKMEKIKALKRINIYLFIPLFIYNMLDAWQTQLLLATGIINEANPLMNFLINHYGIYSLYVTKVVVFTILGTVLYIFHKRIK